MRKSVVNVDADVKTALELNAPFVCFDTETTGLNNVKDRILTLSAIKMEKTGDVFHEIDRMDLHLNPKMHIPEAASKVNGIYDDDVKNLPVEDEKINEIRAFFSEPLLICGYNSNFDIGFMDSLYNRQLFEDFEYTHHLDIMKMAKQKLSLPNYKLVTVAHELGADVGMHAHTSIDDVIMTWRVFEMLLPLYCENEPEDVRTIPVTVTGVKHWQKSHTCNFLFLDTRPQIKASYNIYKKEWKCEDGADIDDLIAQTLTLKGVNDEKELVKAVCG